MAQAKTSKSTRTSKGSAKRSGTAKKASPKPRRKDAKRKPAAKKRSSAKPVDNAAAAREAAAAGTRAAGKAAAIVIERAKVPLAVGGAAVAGIAGGLAVRNRARSRRRGLGLALRDGRLDLDSIAAAARRLGAFSNQVSEVAAAMQRDGDPKS